MLDFIDCLWFVTCGVILAFWGCTLDFVLCYFGSRFVLWLRVGVVILMVWVEVVVLILCSGTC